MQDLKTKLSVDYEDMLSQMEYVDSITRVDSIARIEVYKSLFESILKFTKEHEDTEFMYKVFHMYFYGCGVKRNKTQALYWLEQAAKKGDDVAQLKLGNLYQNAKRHKGIKRNYKKALYWLKKAAAQGNPDAQLAAGIMYRDGKGNKVDGDKAFSYVRKAALQEHEDAKDELAMLYLEGVGTKQNSKKALRWIKS